MTWPNISIPQDLQYILLLFALFVLPRGLQRWRLPSAVTCVALGAVASIGLGAFQQDATIYLLSTLGVVSLFLFAGLDVDFSQLRQNAPLLWQHLVVRVLLLALVTLIVRLAFGLTIQPALLMALALTTPSTGFILDSLGSLGVSPTEAAWIKVKAIATELIALGTLFAVLQPPDAGRVLLATLILCGMVVLLPLVFRLFAAAILPHAPKSEFAFLLIMAVLCALITRHLGAYYLIGAFAVGVTAQRFRQQIPALSSEQTVHALEVFAAFFAPFYFFHAGLQLKAQDFTVAPVVLGIGLVVVFVSLRVGLVALHRRLTLQEPFRQGLRIGVGLIPTLVFTLVVAEILKERFALPQPLFGALIVYTLVNTLIPGFLLGVPLPVFEQLHRTPSDPADATATQAQEGTSQALASVSHGITTDYSGSPAARPDVEPEH